MLAKLFNGNPFASATLTSVLSAIGGYALAHFNPGALTPTGATIFGIATSILGVLVHHNATPTPPAGR